MAQHVGFEAFVGAVTLATLGAQEGLVVRVHKSMFPEVAQLQECLPTLPTLLSSPLLCGVSYRVRRATLQYREARELGSGL